MKDYLFEIGEAVTYNNETTPSIIVDRLQKKNFFFSEAYGIEMIDNFYITEKKLGKNQDRPYRWEDKELYLTSADTEIPEGVVDYESDEHSIDLLDKDGKILKTIKSGKPGYAHEIVTTALRRKSI